VAERENRREFWRRRALERFNSRIESLEEMVEVCMPAAVSEIRSLTHNIYVSVSLTER